MNENNENIEPTGSNEFDLLPKEEITQIGPTESDEKPQKKRKGPWIWIGILFLIISLAIGSWLGYRKGIARRLNLEKTTVVEQAAKQYELAYQDLSSGNLENAQMRIEYVIEIYPTFPGAPELLQSILMQLQKPTPTPTLAYISTPTPNFTATPDLRSEEEAFATIQANIINQEWDAAIGNILAIRQINYNYRTVDVNGYYYVALRNRGIQKIQSGQLEQGLYDLATAEQIGPLDGEADGVRNWAELYLTGASFWDVNWLQAIDIFYQVQVAYPYMIDSSGMTALDRYRIALYKLGDQFAATGNYCEAYEYYTLSLGVMSDPQVQATATLYYENCQNMEKTPEGGFEPTPELTETPPATETSTTPVPETEQPTQEPTQEPTPESTP